MKYHCEISHHWAFSLFPPHLISTPAFPLKLEARWLYISISFTKWQVTVLATIFSHVFVHTKCCQEMPFLCAKPLHWASRHTRMELNSFGTPWREWTQIDDKLWRITLPRIPNIFVEPWRHVGWILPAIYSRLRETSSTAVRSEFLTVWMFHLCHMSVVAGRKMCQTNKPRQWRCVFAPCVCKALDAATPPSRAMTFHEASLTCE